MMMTGAQVTCTITSYIFLRHSYLDQILCFVTVLQVVQYQTVRYPLMPVSPVLRHRLSEFFCCILCSLSFLQSFLI